MAPALYISNPKVAKIIQENQDAMLLKVNPTIKTLMLVRSKENDNDLIKEEQVSPLALNRKLSLEALVFVPKCVIAKKNESRTLALNTIDLDEDSLVEDEEDNMLDICFDRVAREGDYIT
ncbi:hypothetical protein H5410_046706 [Solanum commersonii]|uniref:Uncharacterized protein n=1 Tax=Solanum commersonii TaxID=4109 RepID=A0A9J5XH66_SOLCO|nr:hypothetical protein H5410_046706 [Solanum commersonii]